MIADLTGIMNNLGRRYKIRTYRSVLFPAPAVKSAKALE
jgi:hypothetical protein